MKGAYSVPITGIVVVDTDTDTDTDECIVDTCSCVRLYFSPNAKGSFFIPQLYLSPYCG